MGDRGNIAIIGEDSLDQVWIYSHWNGSELSGMVKLALAARQRWEDAPYLTRIIVETCLDSASDKFTGWGVSTRIGDNEHPIIVVDIPVQIVYTIAQNKLTKGRVPKNYAAHTDALSFDEYLKS